MKKALALLLVATILCQVFVMLTPTTKTHAQAGSAPEVVCVPFHGTLLGVPHDAWISMEVTLKGTAHDPDGDSTLEAYKWDFGDGYSTGWIAGVNPYIIEAKHTYTGTMADGTPYGAGKYFTAWLYVRDTDGLANQDSYFIAIRDKTLDAEVNVAIDDGLWWLHKQASRYTSGGIDYARWSSASPYYTSASAESVLAFEIQGHQPIGNPDENPYVETVQRGLNYVFSGTRVVDISAWGSGTNSPYGDPDTNGNDIGIGISSSQEVYELGMVMMAIAASGDPNLVANTGPTGVVGRAYKDILTDMVDLCAWGQNDYGGARGGWRYGWNYGSSDNSVSQWPMMALEAAETNWGITVADFVKTELDTYWLTYSQNADGSFGYGSPGASNIARTGTGIIGLNYVGLPADNPRIANAVNWLGNHWGEFGNYYGMYAVMKGMRTANPEITMVGTHDWHAEYARYLVDNQQADDGWPDYYGRVLASDWAILVLTPTVTKPGPTADAGPDVENFPPTIPLEFDASGSYHVDPTRTIVLYEWDFETDGIWDYSGVDLEVEHAYPAYYNPDGTIDWDATVKDYTATLRVTDDSDPPLQDTDTCAVHITAPPWKPIADPAGPYEGYEHARLWLDGSKSYDPESKMYPADHPWYETIVEYAWDLDNDGQFDDSTEVRPSFTWETKGTYSIGLRVTDSQPSGPGGTIGPLDFDIKYTTVIIEKPKFILIPSEEDTWPRKPTELTIKREVTHILALNIMDPIDETKSFQERINAINDQGGTAIIAHPKTNLIDERKFTGYVGLEIYNPKAPFGLATDEWDNVLHTKRRVWGFATDDAHEISDFGKAWIMLQAPTLTMNSILDSVNEGNLYATSGPLIEKISVAGNTISIKLPEEMNINVYRFYYSWGWLHDEVYSTTAKELDYTVEYKRFRVGSNDGYVRIEVHSKDGKSSAWTQPFEIDDLANIVNNPYETSGTWYKGQLHCHSTGSDGELTPEEVVNWYISNGYHFLAITDHNRITEQGELRMTTRLEIDVGGIWQKASVKVVDWESVPVKGLKVTGWWEWDGNIREEEPEFTNDDGEVVFHLVEPLLPSRTYTFEFVIKEVTKPGWQWDGGDVRKSVTIGLLEPREAAKKATIMLSEFIQFLPNDAFHHSADTTEQRKNALYEKLITNDDGDAVLQLIDASKYQDAIDKLQNDVRAKMDGDSTAKDWITNPEAQQKLCSMIDSLVACLKTLL